MRPPPGDLLDPIVVGQPNLDGLVVLSARSAGAVEGKRLVRLFRRVLGDLFPKIVLSHRRDCAERPGPLNGGMDSRLRDEGMRPASGAALGGIGLEGRSRPGPMR